MKKSYIDPLAAEVLRNGGKAFHEEPPKKKAHGHALPEGMTAEEILDENAQPPEAIVDELLLPGTTLLVGRPKDGKSYFALEVALCVATGRSVAGHFRVRNPGKVVYLAYEDGESRINARIRQMGFTQSDTMRDLKFFFSCDLPVLDELLTANPCELLIVDTFTAATQRTSSNGHNVVRDEYKQMGFFKQLIEKHHCAILIVHHSKQKLAADTAPVEAVLGSRGLTMAPDTIWYLYRGKSPSTVILATASKDVDHGMHELFYGDGGYKYTGSGEEIDRSAQQREILDLLEEEGKLKISQIARHLCKTIGAVRKLVRKLGRDGLVNQTTDHKYFPVDTNGQRNWQDRDD